MVNSLFAESLLCIPAIRRHPGCLRNTFFRHFHPSFDLEKRKEKEKKGEGREGKGKRRRRATYACFSFFSQTREKGAEARRLREVFFFHFLFPSSDTAKKQAKRRRKRSCGEDNEISIDTSYIRTRKEEQGIIAEEGGEREREKKKKHFLLNGWRIKREESWGGGGREALTSPV